MSRFGIYLNNYLRQVSDSALEYRNDEVWHDVHPLVVPLLSRDG